MFGQCDAFLQSGDFVHDVTLVGNIYTFYTTFNIRGGQFHLLEASYNYLLMPTQRNMQSLVDELVPDMSSLTEPRGPLAPIVDLFLY